MNVSPKEARLLMTGRPLLTGASGWPGRYHARIYVVLSIDPLKTATLDECSHRHRLARKATECAMGLAHELYTRLKAAE